MAEIASVGAYASEDGKPRTRLSLVVYLDILGFTQQIRVADRRGKSDEALARLAGVVNGWYGPAGVMHDRHSKDDRRHWEVKAFTDNVVLARPLRYDMSGEPELGSAFSEIALFQLALAEKHLFVRGGVAVGDVYVDDALVFGMGILDAYEAEQRAVWPRVVLASSAKAYVRKHFGYYSAIDRAPQNLDLLIDSDGEWFVNYLEGVWQDHTEAPIFAWLKKHRTAVTTSLRRFKTDEKVRQKFLNVAAYHDYACRYVLPAALKYAISSEAAPRFHRPQDDAALVRQHRAHMRLRKKNALRSRR